MTEVESFFGAIEPPRRHAEAIELDTLFRKITGFAPRLWSGGILGYGLYEYTYASGRSGSYLATGFAPRKAKLCIYIMPGYTDFTDILARLGKYTKGKSCLYLNKLSDAEPEVLEELIRAGLADLGTQWSLRPS